jgi:D-alanine-D-alanine ligase
MRAALIYDERSPGEAGSWVEAEYESADTIEALLAAMACHCDEAVPLPLGPSLVDDLLRVDPDLAFNIAEGREGSSRESIVPAVLDHLGIVYTGSDAVSLGLSLNKALTKHLARSVGIPTPDFRLFATGEEAAAAWEELTPPLLAKPNLGGSSAGITFDSIVSDRDSLFRVVDEQTGVYGQGTLVESYVHGIDVTVGMLGNGDVELFPAATIETEDGLYSADAKQRHEKRITCPCRLPGGLADKLAEWSVRIYELIGARDFARVDYMMDERGNAWFLEINPLPGLSPYYGVYPVLAEAAGLGHTQLIGRIMELAIERYRAGGNKVYERLAR